MHVTIDSIPDITLPTSESGPPEKPPPPRPGPPPPRPGPPPSRPAQPPSRPAAPPSRPKQPPSRPVVPPSPKRPPVHEQQPTDVLEKSSEMKDEAEKTMHSPPPGTSTYISVVFKCYTFHVELYYLYKYRVPHLIKDIGWVDFDLIDSSSCSTAKPQLPSSH